MDDGTLAMTLDDQPVRDREEKRKIVARELEVKLAQLGRSALLLRYPDKGSEVT